ncbi:MAG: hypothetical protein U1F15_07885 [Burkholderiales bacterium]
MRLVAAGAAAQGDRFEREAARQYAEGHIDPPLWDRAFAQANGDREAAAKLYLKARATALRLLDRDRRTEQRAYDAAHSAVAAVPVVPPAAVSAPLPDYDDPPPAPRSQVGQLVVRYKFAVLTAGVFIAMAVVAWVVSVVRGPAPPPPVVAEAPAPAPKPAAPAPAAAAAPVTAAAPAAKAGVMQDLLGKLQQFRDAQNWNMLVLYAVEWTRLEPGNPAAWNELRGGYMHLRQFEDAHMAARKAVELAPADATMWRNLGYVNLELDDPVAALRAFDEAAARDGHDVDSLRRAGLLNARLGHLPEAKSAFDLALAALPGDAYTLCLKSGVAQAPIVAKDQYSAALQVRAIDVKCRGGDPGAQQAAAAPAPAPAKPAPHGKPPRS